MGAARRRRRVAELYRHAKAALTPSRFESVALNLSFVCISHLTRTYKVLTPFVYSFNLLRLNNSQYLVRVP